MFFSKIFILTTKNTPKSRFDKGPFWAQSRVRYFPELDCKGTYYYQEKAIKRMLSQIIRDKPLCRQPLSQFRRSTMHRQNVCCLNRSFLLLSYQLVYMHMQNFYILLIIAKILVQGSLISASQNTCQYCSSHYKMQIA